MKCFAIMILCISFSFSSFSQNINDQLSAAMQQLSNDAQFKHASLSMYVVDSKNGNVVYEKNSELGMAPASCQKVVTSVSAFEMLGRDYQYKTELGIDGEIKNGALDGSVYVIGYGDPTLGSWRWSSTNDQKIIDDIVNQLKRKGIKVINGNVFGYDRKWESNNTPRGWVWEDIGNYYGAGASSLNWRENQYDIILQAGEKVGDKVAIKKIIPHLENVGFYSEVTTGKKGSGDNAYIYLAPYGMSGYVRGTIPLGEDNFKITGAMPNAAEQMVITLSQQLKDKGVEGILFTGSYNGIEVEKKDLPIYPKIIYSISSPPLDSINYWFLKKSVNLYGEAFVKTIAYEKTKIGSTDTGVAVIKNFWAKRGIDPAALNIIDGSGLSPANRVTTNALVTIMQYAKQQNWFPSFYNALPEMNGIKMKDGYIGGVRSYTGYIKSKKSNEYTFSFIANNFDGNPGTVREKMWKVLDLLK